MRKRERESLRKRERVFEREKYFQREGGREAKECKLKNYLGKRSLN